MKPSPTMRALLLAAGVALIAAAVAMRGQRRTVESTAESIQAQLDALDPVTRAAVIGTGDSNRTAARGEGEGDESRTPDRCR